MNTNEFVLDVSVAGDWIFKQNLTKTQKNLRERALNGRLYAPKLFQYEFGNMLCRRARIEGMVEFDAPLFVFSNLPIIYDDSPNSIPEFVGLAMEFGLTSYDASYLEVANRRKLPLATMDKRLAKAARKLGIETPI